MASPFFDAIKASVSGTPGTGSVTVSTVVSGFRAFSNVPSNTIVDYRIDDGSAWELGFGLWNGTTVARGLKYSSSGSLLSVSSSATISLIIAADEVQPHIGGGKWGQVSAVMGSATPSAFGTAVTAVGTAAAASFATTNYLTRQHRVTATSGAATASGAGFHLGSSVVTVSSTAFYGGFEYVSRFGVVTIGNATNRLQCGVASATTVSGNPSALTDSALFCVDVGDSNISFVSNDASGSGTKTSTGIALAANAFYECAVWANQGERKIYWAISRLDTGATAWGQVTTTADIPTNDVALIPQTILSTGSSATAVAMCLKSLYIRSGF